MSAATRALDHEDELCNALHSCRDAHEPTMPSPFDLMAATARRDEYGNPATCCWDSMQAGRTAGWIEGNAAGRREVLDGIDADAAQAVRNAARSIDVMAARAKADARWSAAPRCTRTGSPLS